MTDVELRSWQVWTARVKFEDSPESKVRPVVIIEPNNGNPICIVFKITSKDRPYGYKLVNWKEAGLDKESTVIIKKIMIERRFIGHYIGTLRPRDIFNIVELINRRNV